jgi:hypothetical protein
MSSANPAFPSKSQSAAKLPVPPDEQFWQRYSPHYEFPLSSVTSFAIHAIALILLFFLGKYLFDTLNKPKSLGEIGVVVEAGGGGGNPEGVGPGPGGELTEPAPAEDTGNKPPPEATPTKPDPKREILNPSVPLVVLPPESKDESVRELIQNAGEAVHAQGRINKEAQEKLRRSIGYGQGGPGSGGGKDRGKDTGTGRAEGPGTGNERYERTLRWVMVFDTYSGDDYARQLAGLGAIIAIPRENNQYAMIHDLNERPARPRLEDVEQIKRIYWTDEKRESITPLCMTLGIRPIPDHIVAFFPESLERKLLKLEMDYKGLREDQIYETRFKIRKTAGGYEPVVIDQKVK